jgi:hypothetical protein
VTSSLDALLPMLRVGNLDAPGVIAGARAITDWRAFVTKASEAGVCAIVWDAINAAGATEAIPKPQRHSLRIAAEMTAARTASAMALAVRIGGLCRQRGAQILVVKGVALALRFPEYATVRYVSDLDLVVRAHDVQTLDAVLAGAGFRRQPHHLDDRLDLIGANTGESKYLDRHGFLVELHDRVPTQDESASEGVWRRSVVTADGVLTPSLEDMLAITCRHALEHHQGQRAHLARMVADVNLLVARGADVVRAKSHHDDGPSGPVQVGIDVAMNGRELPRFAPRATMGKAFLRQASRYGWRYLLPSREYMAEKYGVSPRSPRLPFLYVLRLFEGVARLLRPGR